MKKTVIVTEVVEYSVEVEADGLTDDEVMEAAKDTVINAENPDVYFQAVTEREAAILQ